MRLGKEMGNGVGAGACTEVRNPKFGANNVFPKMSCSVFCQLKKVKILKNNVYSEKENINLVFI